MLRIALMFTVIASAGVMQSAAQIQLPKGFRCVLGENSVNESYFTDGKFSFRTYPWGHEGMKGQEVIDALEENYKHKLKFRKTTDGLFWTTGQVGNRYVYIILEDGVFQYTLTSNTNDVQFSNYSAWLLQQLRNNKVSGKENYFTDYKGKSCFGIK